MNDMELMRRYAAGEEEAFQELVSQDKDSLYAFLWRFLNQSDLVDDVRNTLDYDEHMPDDDLIWDETAAAVIGELETAVEELNAVLALLENRNGGSPGAAGVEPYAASE